MSRVFKLLMGASLLAACARVGYRAADVGEGDATDASVYQVPSDSTDGSDITEQNSAVRVSDLRAVWGTPRWIMWNWTSEGKAEDLELLEFVIADSRADLLSRTASARINRYEAALFPPGPLQLDGTMTGSHTAGQVVFGQMTAIDTEGRRSMTSIVETKTAVDPIHEVVIFSDDDTAGYSIPADLKLSDRAPYAGTHHYEWVAKCKAPATECYEILRRQELKIELATLDQSAFDDAFFEFAMATNSTATTGSRLRVWFGASDHSADTLFNYGGWTVNGNDSYRLYQIPLRVLTNDGNPLSWKIASSGLFEFGIDGTFSDGATVRLDEWRVRW